MQPVRALERGGDVGHRLHLGCGAHLRKGEQETAGQAARVHESTDEQVEGAQAPRASGGLQRLEADADERRRCTGGHGLRHLGGRAHGVGILDGVTAVAVAVLEVEPQVFDGLALQLRAHPWRDLRGEFRGQAHTRGERFETADRLGSGECGSAPFGGQRRAITVGGNVDGVHRLARAVVARVRGAQQFVAVA